MISPDQSFTTLGATTQINWQAAYRETRNLIINTGNTPAIVSLLASLNTRLFGGKTVSRTRVPDSLVTSRNVPVDSSLEAARQALQLSVTLSISRSVPLIICILFLTINYSENASGSTGPGSSAGVAAQSRLVDCTNATTLTYISIGLPPRPLLRISEYSLHPCRYFLTLSIDAQPWTLCELNCKWLCLRPQVYY